MFSKTCEYAIRACIFIASQSYQGKRVTIKDIAEKMGIKISSLGKGLSTGTELEYSDNDTLKNALKNRQ